ncbi:DMT family transporter [Roseovarius faecimaris]|uniref:DMT family transporter n=1 Tax=Roseovarius faecimaris TaxID=2494550 RepID=A0A6I6IU73_9RHOB|nr:DMT family transporter [Roseovarius faecimaris]QGX98896.1 DMT family transporter [Roseovarius faecimaris]
MTALSDTLPNARSRAMGLMIFSSVLISFGGLMIRLMQEADVWQISLYRSLALLCTVSLLMGWRYGRAAPRKTLAIGRPGLLAGCMMAGATLSFLQSITNTTVANTLFMLSAIPFLTAGLAWLLLGERLRRATLLTMLSAVAGITVMVAGGIGAGSLYGNLMGFVCASCFSGYAIVVRQHREVEMLPVLMVSASLIVCLSLVLRWGDLAIPWHDIALCFIIGGVLSGGANALFLIAAKHLAAAELTLIMLLEFALGPLWVWLFLSEVPKAATIVGGAIVIGSVAVRALTELRRGRQRRPRPPLAP